MSKSLKNFISIEEYLSGEWLDSSETADATLKNSPSSRQEAADDLRIFFLQHKYHSSLHFSKDRIDEAGLWRRKVSNTMDLIRSVVDDDDRKSVSHNYTRAKRMNPSGFELARQLQACQGWVDAALRDDFDTPRALLLLTALCSKANVHAAAVLGDAGVSVAPLPSVLQHVTSTLHIFGLSFPTALSVNNLLLVCLRMSCYVMFRRVVNLFVCKGC
jgi:cysteinyl-tRNA synthetase